MFISMIVTTALVTSEDPSDPAVALEKYLAANRGSDDGSSLQFINEQCMFYCSICQSHVIEGSKHCQICNRCTYQFDHHCRWVSNDIGRLNYVNFIRMLVSTIATLLLQIALCIIAFIEGPPEPEAQSFMPQVFAIALNYTTIVFCSIFVIILAMLLGFHAYLINHGMTTVQYIRAKEVKRESKIVKKVEKNLSTIEHDE